MQGPCAPQGKYLYLNMAQNAIVGGEGARMHMRVHLRTNVWVHP